MEVLNDDPKYGDWDEAIKKLEELIRLSVILFKASENLNLHLDEVSEIIYNNSQYILKAMKNRKEIDLKYQMELNSDLLSLIEKWKQ